MVPVAALAPAAIAGGADDLMDVSGASGSTTITDELSVSSSACSPPVDLFNGLCCFVSMNEVKKLTPMRKPAQEERFP